MALGSKNRDYKTSARAIEKNLAKHFKRMQEYIDQGIEREEASVKAAADLLEGKLE